VHRSFHVGFMVDKVALGKVFLQVLWFSPVSIIPPRLSITIDHLGDEQQVHWWPQFIAIFSAHQHGQRRR
jgi:hypothetical protein